jgi:hypothetical protein
MEAFPTIELSPCVSSANLPPLPKDLSIHALRRTPNGSKFTESFLSPTHFLDDLQPCTSTLTKSTTLTITPLPRLRHCFRHRNPRAAAAACDRVRRQYRSDDGIAIHEGGCAAGTLRPLESGEVRLVDVILRAKRDGLLRGRGDTKKRDVVDEVSEGLEGKNWKGLARVLAQVAGPLVDWRFATFYQGYMEDGSQNATGGGQKGSSPLFDSRMLLQDVQDVLGKLEWGFIASSMEEEMKRWRKWENLGCGWVTRKSLQDAEVLKAVRRASRICDVPEGQLRRAVEAYAFYKLSSSSRKERYTLTADRLARERKWQQLAEILVEDWEHLWDEGSYGNGPMVMNKRMMSGVQECRKAYFDQCTAIVGGRVGWTLSLEHRRETAKEVETRRQQRVKEKEEEATCRQKSSDSRAGTLVDPKRFSDATTIVADSLKRHSRELGVKVSELLRRSFDSEEEERKEVKAANKRGRELSGPPCQEAQHYPIFDPTNPSHLASHSRTT